MKKLIGKLAEFYPNHFFYSSDFGKDWNLTVPDETSNVHESEATTSLLAVAVIAGEHLKNKGDKLDATFTSVTNHGKK